MKKERIMKNNLSRFPGTVRPMIYSIASALALMGAASQAQAQFAKTPLYLQNESQIIEQPKIKHNIMFFIDNSQSMNRNAVTGEYTPGLTRMQVTKNALNGILKNHKDKFNWGLQTLYNGGGSDTTPEETFDPEKASWQKMIDKVNKMKPRGLTPATSRYYEVVTQTVMPNIKYRCQKSYVVMMSDGDANFGCNFHSKGFSYNFDYDNPKGYYSIYPSPYRPFLPKNEAAYRYFGPSALAGLSNNQLSRLCSTQGVHNMPYWDSANGYNGKVGGIEFFSRTLSVKDIKTAADGVDAAGVSWDGDPSKDPKGVDYSKQLVQTFTVGFGQGISDAGKAFLTRGASQDDWYFNADKPEDLENAFNKIISLISTDSASPPFEGEGGTAPATSSSGIPDLAATIKLNTGSWSSQILFNKLDNNNGRRAGGYSYPAFLW